MKICVLGLDSAVPDIIFGDERLVNLRRLMDLGIYGRLDGIVPPGPIPAAMCMSTSQDPGSLGIYGPGNRADHSYGKPVPVNSNSTEAVTIWDQLEREGKKSILVGVPPNSPPRRVNGLSIGWSSTPDYDFTWPAEFKGKIQDLIGEYPGEVENLEIKDYALHKREIFDMSGKQWSVARWLLTGQEWDYFQFVDSGLDRIQRRFWKYFDPQHVEFKDGNPYQDVIPEYYLWLDEQIGSVLELLDDDTLLLAVSDHGTQRLDGGFAINEWLIREGLLVLKEYPAEITPFEKLDVDWSRTKVWSEGGHYARIYFNVQGREPQGIIAKADGEALQTEVKARLEALPGVDGHRLKSLVFKPQEIYRNLRNVAPDLIVYPGELHWSSIGSVGHAKLHIQQSDGDSDSCNYSQQGMFILTAPNLALNGEYEGAGLLDIAPTLLDLAGYQIPESMQGCSLVSGTDKKRSGTGSNAESARIVHDRLAGLGYV